MQHSSLDSHDLQLIHALQIDPRISWNILASILPSDPATLARRWARIEREGIAWISAVSGEATNGTGGLALVEFVCEPGAVLTTAAAAATDPAIFSIDLTAGRRDLIATLAAPDDAALAEYALERLGAIPGIRDVRTHVVTEVLRLGSDWTVQALTPAEQARVPAPRPPRAGSAKRLDPSFATRLRRLLATDGRASYVELGERLGVSAQRASDAIALLRRSGSLVLRTDVAAPYTNWPLAAWFFLEAPAATAARAAEAVAGMPEVQYASLATGPYNLIVATGARAKSELLRIESELERRLPGARIADRSVVLRVHKHLGRILDRSGRSTGVIVPMA